MFAIPCLFLLAAVPDEHPSAVGKDGDFVLEARVLEMVEGGPVTIEAVLTYKGDKRVQLHCSRLSWLHNASVRVPSDWEFISRTRTIIGMVNGMIEMAPGDKRREVIHLHEDYTGIKAGKIKLPVCWRVRTPEWDGDKRKFTSIAEPEVVLELNVPRATPDRLSKIRECLEKRFDKVDKSQTEWSRPITSDDHPIMELQDIALYFRNTPHVEFVPLSMKFLELRGYPKAKWHGDFIFRASRTSADAHRLFVDHLLKSSPPAIAPLFTKWWNVQRTRQDVTDDLRRLVGARSVFEALRMAKTNWELSKYGLDGDFETVWWFDCPCDLPDEQLRRLELAPDLWVRALTYATFGERCDPTWAKRLLAELEHSQDPLDSKLLDGLIVKLDAPGFRDRENAHRELMSYGVRVREGLKKALAAKPSAEVERRVGELLKYVDKIPIDPRDAEAMEWLTWRNGNHPLTTHSREILKALSQAERSSWVAGKAKNILAGRFDDE